MNKHEKEINELTMEIMALAYTIQIKTDYAVFIDFSGHVDNMRIDIAKSAEDYHIKLATTCFRTAPFGNTFAQKDWTGLIKDIKEKRDILKKIADDCDIDYEGMTEIASTTYHSCF